MNTDYTISSSSVVNPNICSITCKVLRDPKVNSDTWDLPLQSRAVHGVCSNYLLREGSMCRAYVRESTFKLPTVRRKKKKVFLSRCVVCCLFACSSCSKVVQPRHS